SEVMESSITDFSRKDVSSISIQSQITNQNNSTPITTEDANSGGKDQLVALLLVIFLGYLGIHRFYLGYTWQGIVQLLTVGGLGIWWLIDLIRIVTGDLGPKEGSYTHRI